MIKLSLFLTRRADLTPEQLRDHWLNTHWPLVQTVPEVKRYTRRYVQQHPVGGLPPGVAAAPYDGCSAQAALARLLSRKPWIAPIPGTTKVRRLQEDVAAAAVALTDEDLREIKARAGRIEAHGERYPEAAQKRITASCACRSPRRS